VDDAEAARLLRTAAENGHPTAQYNLGLMFAQGRGVERDLDEAARWIRLAADQGVEAAEQRLGMLAGAGDARGDLAARRR
jgi:TPR repeat protein